MRIFFAFFLCLGLASVNASAQERLVMYPSFGGVHYEYEKDTSAYQVTPKQVSQILFIYPEAKAEFQKARRHSTWSGVLGFLGAGLVAMPVVTAIAGGDAEWGYAAGGAALIGASIPLSISYRKKAQHALDMFNQRHGRAALPERSRLYFSGTAVKLVIRF